MLEIKNNYKNFTINSELLSKYKIQLKNFYMISGHINQINEKIINNIPVNLDHNFIIHKHFIHHITDINESFDTHYPHNTPLNICNLM